ncbi:DNA-directed RNA polymerase sigma-70 factor [Marivirga lumbricoides]|uniref:DNA-directed RNA polymerase sigma-70 factor n=3 Tax=Marivirga lumbricoides TaxID=1046115 RepID=A0ABQ1LDM9_9BACT|nr:DNA-directed RNA polymerase sigma-70 factor [Marivirga lumbricoides]
MYRDTKEDREDLFQEITYQLWKSFDRFEARSKFSTWMYRIGLNTAMAAFRKPSLEHSRLDEHLELPDTVSPDNEQENNEILFSVIRQLNEADRALLSLYFEELSYAEIGEILGISESNVGARLTRMKEKIRKLVNV